ncbi:MAG: M6 family metalloprotease domain-containing protein [Eubacterium sp.]|nr:M6 family metalloprotease domain-containing protein [Eubacterium sp.]
MIRIRRIAHILVITTVLILLAILMAAESHAVPAAPGSDAKGAERGCRSQVFPTVTLSDLRKTPSGPTNRKNVNGLKSVTEDIPTVIIVVGFENMPYDNTFNWSGEIFSGTRSLSKYYSDMSLGQFTFTPVIESSKYGTDGNTNTKDAANDGIIHVKLSTNHDEWTTSYDFPESYPYDKSEMEALSAAISAASAYMDFSAYDSNNDGKIDNSELAVGFVVAGYEAATGNISGRENLSLWSHAWSFSEAASIYGSSYVMPAVPTADGVKVDGFIAISELSYNYNHEAFDQAPISILAHELGHYIGLPDLYDTTGINHNPWSGYTPGYLSLMDDGAYGYDENGYYSPYSLDIWSRIHLGWITPQVVSDPADETQVSIAGSMSTGTGTKALKITTDRENEYYLAENRRFTGWDVRLGGEYGGCSDGIVLWHIDDDIYDQYCDYNSVNDSDHHPAVTPLYLEYNNGKYEPIGTELSDKVFFSRDTYSEPLYLPLYSGDSKYDLPEYRTDASCLRLNFPSASSASMNIKFTHSHVWDAGEITKEPTSTTPGEITYTCVYCDATRTEEIDKLPPRATIRWSSVDGVDVVSPLSITVTDGMTVENLIYDNSTLIYAHFSKPGYQLWDLKLKPLTSYASTEAYNSDNSLTTTTPVTDGMTIYLIMRKEIAGEIEITVKAPVCGVSTTTPQGSSSWDWDKQTNHPVLTYSGTYKSAVDPARALVVWLNSYSNYDFSPFIGKFNGGSEYAMAFDLSFMPGYFATDRTSVKLTGATELSFEYDDEDGDYIFVIAKTKAEHNWDAGKVTKPATATAAGVRTFTCKACGATKTSAIPKLDPASQMGTDGTPVGPGASAEAAEAAITGAASDEGPAGTQFGSLRLKASKVTKSSIKLTWKKVSGAKKYVLYANKCGKGKKYKKLATYTKTSVTIKKVAGAKLKKGTYYKFMLVALNGSGNVISTSKTVHAGTSGGKAGNPTKVTTKAKKNKVTVKVKKTFKLAAKQAGKNVKKHRVIKYESSNKAVATVSAKGVIKGVKKGKCKVYAYAQNGVCAVITVTVK